MMTDIIEEPEKDSLLGLRPEAHVLAVMLKLAANANVGVHIGQRQPPIWIIGMELYSSHVQTASPDYKVPL